MTWLEIMDVLDKMPRHLLKKEASLWHYDEHGEYEVLPVHDVLSPLNDCDCESKEWEPGGAYGLSLQSFDDEKPKPEPKQTFVVLTSTILGQQFSIEADDADDAREKANRLVHCERFFKDRMHANWSYDNEWDCTEVVDVVTGWDTHGDDDFVAPDIVDKYLNGKEG